MASGGKDTREYGSILSSLNSITESLKVNQSAKDTLTRKFQEHKWLDTVAKPTEGDLVRLALSRIENDVNQFAEFMTMLKQTAGMDIIVEKLKGTRDVITPHINYHNIHIDCNIIFLITSFNRSCGPGRNEKLCVSIYN